MPVSSLTPKTARTPVFIGTPSSRIIRIRYSPATHALLLSLTPRPIRKSPTRVAA